jgi:hypothetical protein
MDNRKLLYARDSPCLFLCFLRKINVSVVKLEAFFRSTWSVRAILWIQYSRSDSESPDRQ